jgi:hypothetical protein
MTPQSLLTLLILKSKGEPMKTYDIQIDGVVLSKLTSKEIDSHIKLLTRKNYQIFDFRKKDMIIHNLKNEDQDIAVVVGEKR